LAFSQRRRYRSRASNFDDAAWRKLDVPHDWSIEGPSMKRIQRWSRGFLPPASAGTESISIFCE